MLIRILMLGKTRRAEIRNLLDDYAGRIRRFAEIELREIREDAPAVLRKLQIGSGAAVVLLDAGGKKLDSDQFAKWIGDSRDRGTREVIFLCGAAEGFPPGLAKSATAKMSLSPMTFSHELARVMLIEQIYRAFTLLSGHPYAK